MVITLLGTGTSSGIPLIGCRCDVCRSLDYRDKRLRAVSYTHLDVYKRQEKNKAKLEQKIKKVLADIDQQIQQDNQEANQQEITQKIDTNLLKQKLGELNKKLKESSKSTQKQIQKLQEEHLPRLEMYQQQLQILGDRNSFSKTDQDATFMRMKAVSYTHLNQNVCY